MEIHPIAYINTDFDDKFGIPRQSGRVPQLKGRIVFEPEYRGEEAIRGIDAFSHLWLIFGFSKAERERPSLTVRPPRLGGNTRVGVFASRAPFRPNSLGLSLVRLEGIEKHPADGEVLIVSGIDMLNQTPIYDIKPYLPYAECKPEAVGGYGDLMSQYTLEVVFPEEMLSKLPKEKQQAVIHCLKDDPRPSYHQDERIYSMRFGELDIRFQVKGSVLTVVGIDGIKS